MIAECMEDGLVWTLVSVVAALDYRGLSPWSRVKGATPGPRKQTSAGQGLMLINICHH